MTWLDFIALTLAASAVIDVWFNGSIFADFVSFFQIKGDYPDDNAIEIEDDDIPEEPQPVWLRMADKITPRWTAELLSCPFCLSHHTPFWVAVLFFVPSVFMEDPWAILVKIPMYCLAATRLGNIVNGLLPEHASYDRTTKFDSRGSDKEDV